MSSDNEDSSSSEKGRDTEEQKPKQKDPPPKKSSSEGKVERRSTGPVQCSAVISEHYNSAEKGLHARNLSRILHLRNFNNWIKSHLIDEFVLKVRDKHAKDRDFQLTVFDMCCGKGGDLFKWRSNRIDYLVCSDIARVAVDNCRKRHESLARHNRHLFKAEFIVADLTRVNIMDEMKVKSTKFDLVSCQFAFHYCFESLAQAECMLRNASQSLKPGGFFIGTLPDAYSIVSKAKASGKNTFGNSVFNIKFSDLEDLPLFGAKYNFSLEGVVNCPEFLVYFPVLVKMAKKYGLTLIKKCSFHHYYEERKKKDKHGLIMKMSALETYPARRNHHHLSWKEEEYSHCKKFLEENQNIRHVGTLSKSEWEAASIYLVFAFLKTKDSG